MRLLCVFSAKDYDGVGVVLLVETDRNGEKVEERRRVVEESGDHFQGLLL